MGNWAVVPGVVRDVPHFTRLLNRLLQWRAEGLLDGIVFSTWTGEVEKVPGLAGELDRLGIARVQVPEPPIRMPGHILHQMKALFYGLSACPDGSRVLKLRTDKVELPSYMETVLRGECDVRVSPAGWPSVLQERLIVPSCPLNSPFFSGDMWFFGRKEDVAKLVHFDLRYSLVFLNPMPEQWFYSHPFIEAFPIFQDYFCVSPAIGTPQAFDSLVAAWLDENFYLNVLATYFLIVDRYFRVVSSFTPHQEAVDWENFTYGDILRGRMPPSPMNAHGQWLWRIHPALGFTEMVADFWTKPLLSGAPARDRLRERFLEAVTRVSRPEYHATYKPSPLLDSPQVARFAAVTRRLCSPAPRHPNFQNPKSF